MEKKLKVSVTFQLEVPIQTDSAGRRRSIPDQIHPYISDYFANLQSQLHFVKHGMKISVGLPYSDHNREQSDYDANNDFDMFDRINQVDLSSICIQSEQTRVCWEKQKDLECWQFFKMGWEEFKTLSWTDQAKLREAHGVVWENNTWVKKGIE